MPEVVLRPAEEEDIAEMLALYAPPVAHLYPKAAVAGLPH
mgnify:CR=1 FL=1